MAAVERLCHKAIYLQKGEVQYIGSQTEAIARYTTNTSETKILLNDRKDRQGSGEIRIVGFDVRDLDGNSLDIVRSGQDIDICLFYKSDNEAFTEKLIVSLAVKTQMEIPVFLHHNRLTKQSLFLISREGEIVCRINKIPLPSSTYLVTYSLIRDNDYLDGINNAFEINVVDGDFFGGGEVPPISHGVCLVEGSWRVEDAA
jgi:lipopolysaccharide transport system ATP-binding protein